MSLLKVNDVQDTGGSSLIGRKNYIINGNFDVWQRGVGPFTTGYNADRWEGPRGTSTLSLTQESFTNGQTDVPNNPEYYTRSVVSTGSTASSYVLLRQKVEGVRTLAGETATLSFWAKADSAKNIAAEIVQDFGSGGSPSSSVTGIDINTISLTTSWQKFTVEVSVPSISGKTLGTDGDDFLMVVFWLDAGSDFDARTNSLGNQSGTFDIAQVQLEKGSSATQFEHRSYGEELALCQRYYQRVCEGTGVFTVGQAKSTTEVRAAVAFTSTVRAIPTVSISSVSNFNCRNTTGSSIPVSAVSSIATTLNYTELEFTTGSMGAGNASQVRINTNSGYLEIDAEL